MAGGPERTGNPADSRRVQPVPEAYDPDEVYSPDSSARPALAVWLSVGPVLFGLGVAGWMILLSGVRRERTLEWSAGALALDGALLLIFLLVRTGLARGWGRKLLNRPFGPDAERPLYVLLCGLALCLMCLLWVDCGPLLYKVDPLWRAFPHALQIAGLLLASWGVIVSGVGHAVGLPHLRALEKGRQAPKEELVALPPYAWVRHPVSLGAVLMLVGMTEVSADRLMLMIVMSAWLLFFAPAEERDLEAEFGEAYARYRARTGRWIPRLPRREP